MTKRYKNNRDLKFKKSKKNYKNKFYIRKRSYKNKYKKKILLKSKLLDNKLLTEYKITNIKNNIFDSEYPIFVNFYTGDNGYKKYNDKLIASLNKFKLPYYIFEIHSNGDKWEKICQQKPYAILNVLNKYPNKNVVWVDADAIIEKEPELFKKIEKNFAVHYNGTELLSGVLYFKNNKNTRNIISDWIELNNQNPDMYDQVSLSKVINRKYKQHEYKLPKEYCSIFDKPGYQGLDRVISQWQASRELKYSKRNKDYGKRAFFGVIY